MLARDIITKDFGWKLFSLVLALCIWLAVSSTSHQTVGTANQAAPTEDRIFSDLPVVVTSSTADVREFKVNPATVDVAVRGRPEVIKALTTKEIRVTVDLTDIDTVKDLNRRVDVSTPPGVTFVNAWPSLVDVIVPSGKEFGK